MKKSWVVVITIMLALMIGATAHAYNGILDTSDGGLVGTGPWADGSSVQWWVTQNEDNSWHYVYEFIFPDKDVSHFILETSDFFTMDDIWNIEFESGGYSTVDLGGYGPGSGNPNIPGDINGLKFDSTWGTDVLFSFDSSKQPVWGDFYAKDGKSDGQFVTIWNGGFADDDPTAPAADGTIGNHILRPDTIVPEPSSMLVLGGGLAMLGNYIRRRRSVK